MHRRSHFKKHYTKSELAAGINICRKCHDGIHKTYTEMELAKQLNTLQLLCSDDKLGTYFAWVAKQKIHS
ncbi:MAG: Uncharacterised protein [Glaciecola sp. HTCC2999]|jgi:hypothetical protein|nr:MAG: Uncharacterised protein [Glaciecola sp. HTCC2999]